MVATTKIPLELIMIDQGSILSVNGMQAVINTPPALQGEGLHQLPPHRPVRAYVVDEYPACPDTWEHGSDKASSYFVSLQEGNGMWFDFTANEHSQHHIAVVVSVQGINPVTNKPITELCLVQHKKKCPIHGVDFQQDRYCPHEGCKYKWPAQNYIATTTGKQLWIDGFMNAVGETRQYIISAEEARGIAKQIEDKDPDFKRVWAIGFAFYLSVEERPAPPPPTRSVQPMGGPAVMGSAMGFDGDVAMGFDDDLDYEETSHLESSWVTPAGLKRAGGVKPSKRSGKMKSAIPLNRRSIGAQSKSQEMGFADITPVTPVKKVEVGAGARISQDLGTDPNDIKFWQPEPIGMIYVNLTDPETLQKILDAGRRQDKPEGSLNGLRVGND